MVQTQYYLTLKVPFHRFTNEKTETISQMAEEHTHLSLLKTILDCHLPGERLLNNSDSY